MKRYYVSVLLLCLFSTHVFAQDEVPLQVPKNEINLGYFNMFNLANSSSFGVGYKHTYNKGALRIGTGFELSSQNQDNDRHSYTIKSNRFSVTPSIGYEYHKNIKQFQIFYGVDLIGQISSERFERKYENDIDPDNENSTKGYSVGFRPVLGLKYQINNWLSVTTETGVVANYSHSESISKTYNEEAKTTSNGIYVALRSLGIVSINIHFN